VFPKFLASFKETETAVKPESHSETQRLYTKICDFETCDDSNCLKGLSFFEYDICHVSVDTPINFSDFENAKSIIKIHEKQRVKGMKFLGYLCYQYDVEKLPTGFRAVQDGGKCKNPIGHVSIVVSNEDGVAFEEVEIARVRLHYCKDLITHGGWTPHCIRLLAQAEPKSLDTIKDFETFRMAMTLYEHIDCLSELYHFIAISDLLKSLEENHYLLFGICTLSQSKLYLIIEALECLVEAVNTAEEAVKVLEFRSTLQELLDLKEVKSSDNVEKSSIIHNHVRRFFD
jgi:hypothetical protein